MGNKTEAVLAEIARRECALLAAETAKLATAVNGQRCDPRVPRGALRANVSPSTRRVRADHNPYDPRGRA